MRKWRVPPSARSTTSSSPGATRAQEAEVRVAVRGDDRVAAIARQRGAVEMTRSERQRAARRAGEHQHVGVLRRRNQARDGMRVRPRPRLDRRAGRTRACPTRRAAAIARPAPWRDVGAVAEAQRAGEREQCDTDCMSRIGDDCCIAFLPLPPIGEDSPRGHRTGMRSRARAALIQLRGGPSAAAKGPPRSAAMAMSVHLRAIAQHPCAVSARRRLVHPRLRLARQQHVPRARVVAVDVDDEVRQAVAVDVARDLDLAVPAESVEQVLERSPACSTT